jgi:hypothetical protein
MRNFVVVNATSPFDSDDFSTLQDEIKHKWFKIMDFVEAHFERRPDLNAVLFLVGIRELGLIPERNFTKEQKTQLMSIASCKVLSYSGYYELEGQDEQGWPQWKNTQKLPNLSVIEQENLLRQHLVEYFEREGILSY